MVEKFLKKVVVWFDLLEFKSIWFGNKSVYCTCMVLVDNGELIVLVFVFIEFGEDKQIDKFIRKYGYFGTFYTLKLVEENEDLRNNFGAVAYLIHGSSENRFKITYCPGHISREEIESVKFTRNGSLRTALS